MRVHFIQHVNFEGSASIRDWCRDKRLSVSRTAQQQGDALPALDELDMLVILGGPMGVADTHRYPWLDDELAFIRRCIDAGKAVLGICLGAQLIARALGAPVTRNPDKEIGWYAVERHAAIEEHALAGHLPERFDAFHWHGDTFSVPGGALPLAASAACPNQGFVYNDRVIALQFHLETSLQSLRLLIQHCRAELIEGPFIQTETEMVSKPERFDQGQQLLFRLLDYLLAQATGQRPGQCP